MFRAVLRADFVAGTDQVAYVAHDSLTFHVDDAGLVNEAEIKIDIAGEAAIQLLTAVKHMDTLPDDLTTWAQLVCNETDYVEVIFKKTFAASDVEVVRIRYSDYADNLRTLRYGKASPGDMAIARHVAGAVRASKAGAFGLETL